MRETKAGLVGFDVLLLHLVDAGETRVLGTHSSRSARNNEHVEACVPRTGKEKQLSM